MFWKRLEVPFRHFGYLLLFALGEGVVWSWHFVDGGPPLMVTIFGHIVAGVGLGRFLLSEAIESGDELLRGLRRWLRLWREFKADLDGGALPAREPLAVDALRSLRRRQR